MATLLFLGSGSAYTVGADNFQSNLLLTNDQGERLLIDCGSDIRLSLYAAGFSYRDVASVYISHLHSDHAGGLEYVGFNRKFDPSCDRPTLYTSHDIAVDIWDRCLSGGMRSLHEQIATLDTFFQLQAIANGKFRWGDIDFQLVPVRHVHNGVFQMPSYGLFFELNGTRIFISTDCQLELDKHRHFYESADIIFHDCETSQFPTPVHTHYSDLLDLPAAIRQKIWLYGHHPGYLPDAAQDGFLGFVQRGQEFQFFRQFAESSPSLSLVA